MIESDNIKIDISSSPYYLTEVYQGVVSSSNYEVELPQIVSIGNGWGNLSKTTFFDHYSNLEYIEDPKEFKLIYLSYTEYKFYHIIYKFQIDFKKKFSVLSSDSRLLIGMAPYGGIAVWIRGFNKSILIDWLKGIEIEVEMADFHPVNPDITLQEYCDFYINNDSIVKENLKTNGLPPRNLFDKYMQQFTYRYQPLFEKWDDREEVKWQKYKEDELRPEFEYIEESLFDGTFDKLHDDCLLKYHEAGKPKKLAIKWHIKKTEYTAYFWFEDEKICSIFERFYGAHPDTKTDFIIRIDSEKRKYELALFRQGLKEPQIIPEDAYQLLVFKNKFEDYRSDNYNQERGAWIW